MSIEYFIRKQDRLIAKVSLNYVRNEYLKLLQEDERLIGLIGSRGVGKTTLLLQYLKNLDEKYLYVSADDVEFINIQLKDLIEEFYSLGGRTVVIDEMHKYKNWARELKNIYDSYPDMSLRISGSSMINILFEKYDLSRRLVLYRMSVLSFREYLELSKDIKFQGYPLDTILSSASEISKELVFEHEDLYAHFKTYLQHGAYPFYLEGITTFNQKLFNALDKVISEDIPSLNKIDYSHIVLFKKLIYIVLSAGKPYKVNIAKLSRVFGISEPTLYSYLEILDKTEIFNPVKKYSTKISKKPEKLLFSNTNILHAYAKEFNLDVDEGTLRESYFASCFESIYYSDIGDFKVNDFIFEVGGKNKNFKQIKDIEKSYLVLDIDFTSNDKKIPLWLFGFINKN
ncbi:MAG: AAA family ATPase [Campylobacterota bacterium]|nr:AAA family ATPase [Campylobacterota bacterium]